MRARALGSPNDRTEIVGIGQLVADDNERRLARVLRLLLNIVDACIIVRRDHGNDTLMRARGRHIV